MLPEAKDGTYVGLAYRHCSLEYAQISTETTEGSKREGGRFNPRGEFGALYAALDRETAERELARLAHRLGLSLDMLMPRVMLTIEIHLTAVLDLRTVRAQQEWGLTYDDLHGTDFTICQEIARAAKRAGYEAICFPSATRAGDNLAIFLDQLRPGSKVVLAECETFIRSDVAVKYMVDLHGIPIVGVPQEPTG